MIGGLLFSTTLSLLVVPTLYLWVAQHIEPRLGGFHRAPRHPGHNDHAASRAKRGLGS